MLSGVNEHKMAISEIGVSYPDPSFGKESRIGNVFTFMMRDVI
jgi:isopenicillin-N N-acyltransferase like protein